MKACIIAAIAPMLLALGSSAACEMCHNHGLSNVDVVHSYEVVYEAPVSEATSDSDFERSRENPDVYDTSAPTRLGSGVGNNLILDTEEYTPCDDCEVAERVCDECRIETCKHCD